MSTSTASKGFQPVPLEAQAAMIQEQGLDTLFFCPNGWALRHRFISEASGETVRARCGSWSCLYCGPRKVDVWRQLVKAAEPTLFVTLTKCGSTLKEAARTLTTVLQYLRRGAKGRGKRRKGAREAYPIQVFAVLEEHSDFEENGFHWHLLVKGVDFLPNQVVSDALRSATRGRSYITKTVRVRNNRAVGYVTKYLTKEIMRERRGMIEEERVMVRLALDEQGEPTLAEERQIIQRMCKAHRIRYSKEFFPTSTKVLRQQIFGEKTEEQEEAEQIPQDEEGEQPRTGWILYEAERLADESQNGKAEGHRFLLRRKDQPDVEDEERNQEARQEERENWERRVQQYRQMRERALLESVQAFREGRRMYSRRILGIWNYQRERVRMNK